MSFVSFYFLLAHRLSSLILALFACLPKVLRSNRSCHSKKGEQKQFYSGRFVVRITRGIKPATILRPSRRKQNSHYQGTDETNLTPCDANVIPLSVPVTCAGFSGIADPLPKRGKRGKSGIKQPLFFSPAVSGRRLKGGWQIPTLSPDPSP